MADFASDLKNVLRRSESNDFSDNYDYRRFGEPQPDVVKPKIRFFKSLLIALGLKENPLYGQSEILKNSENLDFPYTILSDDESKDILLRVMAYRILGYRKVKLPLNTPEYWARLDAIERRAEGAEKIDLGYLGWQLSRMDLSTAGYPLRLCIRPGGLFTQFILQQYRCLAGDTVIEVEPGDTVIDGGGCFGDTALYFATKAGENGRVFSFEFTPDNLRVFRENLDLNPALAKRVQIVENPMWSSSGRELFIEGFGPGTHLTFTSQDPAAKKFTTISIDDLVHSKNIDRVDFVKMDIEGAELEALKGAETTIMQHRPKLAISVYHRLQDFWEIPRWIDGLGLGYSFYLRHFTIHAEETVLFAVPEKPDQFSKK